MLLPILSAMLCRHCKQYCLGIPRLVSIRNKTKIEYYFLFLWLVYAIVIAGLRGPFTADYINYEKIFAEIGKMTLAEIWARYNILTIFSELEPGYVLLNYFVSVVSSNSLLLFCTVSGIITTAFFYVLTRYSLIAWLSILLFISIGPYLESFNTVRNVLAASIFSFAIIEISKGHCIRYVLITLCAALFHASALVMLPMYWVLRVKVKLRNIVLLICLFLVSMISARKLAVWYNLFFHVSENSHSVILLFERSRSNGTSLLVPIFCSLLAFFLYYYNRHHNIQVTSDCSLKTLSKHKAMQRDPLFIGTLVWAFCVAGMLVTSYTTRFACYFFSCIAIFLPEEISICKSKLLGQISLMFVASICTVWFVLLAILKYSYSFVFSY